MSDSVDDWAPLGAGTEAVGEVADASEAPLLAALREAQSEAASLRSALADNDLDLLEARGAHARALAALRSEIASRDEAIAARDAALAARDDLVTRLQLQRAEETDAARARTEELQLRLQVATSAARARADADSAGHSECERLLAEARADADRARAAETAARASEAAAADDCAVLAEAKASTVTRLHPAAATTRSTT